MQSLRSCVKDLASACMANISRQQFNIASPRGVLPAASIHTSSVCEGEGRGPTKFMRHNKTIFPIQSPDEERRPAYVCHMKTNVKYSLKKMWYIACLVRGMTVDEAVKQLSFVLKKGAEIAKETILEAQKLAIEKHNVEFKSNLWVAESFASRGRVIKGIRRHGKGRVGEIRYGYIHYFVRLEEGPPPEHYYLPLPKDKETLLANWKENMRKRKIYNSL